jgi:hypothetical protein
LYKFIERIELLSDKPLLFEEARDDSPAIFLGDFFAVLINVRPSSISRVFIGYGLRRGGSGYDKRT